MSNGADTLALADPGTTVVPALACFVPPTPDRSISKLVSPEQERFIVNLQKIWPNHIVIHYHLASETTVPFVNVADMQQSVRDAFQVWKDVGIGLDFAEVENGADAEIRVSFDVGRSNSYVGTDNLNIRYPQPTMNFGWDQTKATGNFDTALHEVGHAIGAQHEHQNWNAGIEWNEESTIRHYSGPPNYWDSRTTRWNIIRKLNPRLTEAGKWDKNSIMHYTIQPGLASSPENVRRFGVRPVSGLSDGDRAWVRHFYPPKKDDDVLIPLEPYRSVLLDFSSSEQREYLLNIKTSREYVIGTFGKVDTKMALYELYQNGKGDKEAFVADDDDSGEDRNARITARLLKGKQYELRVRMVFGAPNQSSLMMF